MFLFLQLRKNVQKGKLFLVAIIRFMLELFYMLRGIAIDLQYLVGRDCRRPLNFALAECAMVN